MEVKYKCSKSKEDFLVTRYGEVEAGVLDTRHVYQRKGGYFIPQKEGAWKSNSIVIFDRNELIKLLDEEMVKS